ncbi:transcription antitermination factor NusB [Corynebacterium sp. 13CS0277]|uniref:transcription antitermination factor NusB n=1 Tax=Corynebacterium sp. 13CS0277 TaxID=2071994 RepID=UPI000D03E590|nr:transcription antitermination factor NusB [Corynebacterium sp. 13CS0277]PRQ11952.1 transcription antitermination factor NusB [Corynebacterium sp. 13CS0277]
MADNNRFRRHGSRFKARSRAVDILFEAEARDVDPVAIMRDRMVLARQVNPVVPPVSDYTAAIVEGVAVDLDGLDDTIARHLAEDWRLDRIPAVDRAILRVSTWELLRNPEVPVRAAVVEGIELAATFSTDAAPPYINAVLDQIAGFAEDVRSGALPAFPTLELAEEGNALDLGVDGEDEFAGIEFEVDDDVDEKDDAADATAPTGTGAAAQPQTFTETQPFSGFEFLRLTSFHNGGA